jgi:aspartate racemase
MKTIGLIGGMSWESSVEYYRIMNELVRERMGSHHSAKILMNSIDFSEIEQCQGSGMWECATGILTDAAQSLERGGADCLLIGANTMHKLYGPISESVSIPTIHIADATAKAIQTAGMDTVGLLGTKYTMVDDFYRKRLKDQHGIETIIPKGKGLKAVHEIIYNELTMGIIRDESRERYREIIDLLRDQGAQGIILGCTEIPLLISQEHSSIPVFDTTRIHSEAAVDFALE